MTTRRATKEQQIKAREYLLEDLHPGDTIYTILKHVSSSGMYRVIDTYLIKDNWPLRLTWNIAAVCGYPYNDNHEGIGVSGCGMDMGFHIVYNLSYALFKDGYALKQSWLG